MTNEPLRPGVVHTLTFERDGGRYAVEVDDDVVRVTLSDAQLRAWLPVLEAGLAGHVPAPWPVRGQG